jgi:hypothetical protein
MILTSASGPDFFNRFMHSPVYGAGQGSAIKHGDTAR